MDPVRDRLRAWQPEFAAIRQDIHAHPELGNEEVRTAAIVAEKLRSYGNIDVTEGVGGTGVVGVLRGRQEGHGTNRRQSIGLRADMDALALTEQTGLPYASKTSGRMHACGHDGHTTMLLAAARYLSENPDFAGTVNFIFQPAEEGRGGARRMLTDGLFERFPCDAVYGVHNGPGMEAGSFAIRKGPMMAGGGRWQVSFHGTGGHGGFTPHEATDVSVVLGHFLLGVQTVVSRNVAPGDTAVISVGYVQGGDREAANVMPSKVTVGGTMRFFEDHVREIIDARVKRLAETLAASSGCTAEVTMHWGMNPLSNHADEVHTACAAARRVFDPAEVDGDTPPITGGEDFGEMLRVKPGAFAFIGNGVNPDGVFQPVHTPRYDFNDAIIPDGAAYWVSLVQEELSPSSS